MMVGQMTSSAATSSRCGRLASHGAARCIWLQAAGAYSGKRGAALHVAAPGSAFLAACPGACVCGGGGREHAMQGLQMRQGRPGTHAACTCTAGLRVAQLLRKDALVPRPPPVSDRAGPARAYRGTERACVQPYLQCLLPYAGIWCLANHLSSNLRAHKAYNLSLPACAR